MPRPLAIAAATALTVALAAAEVAASGVAWGVSVNLPGVAVRAGAPAFWGAGVAVGPWAPPIVVPYAVVPPPIVVPVPAWTAPFPVGVAVPVAVPVPVLVPRVARVAVAPYVPIRRAYVPAPVRHPPRLRAVHY